jgi:hypothetical protein
MQTLDSVWLCFLPAHSFRCLYTSVGSEAHNLNFPHAYNCTPDFSRLYQICAVCAVFRIADHVRPDICNGPCLCLVQALLKTPRPSAKSERRPFLIRQFRRSRPLKR